jgi:hypothetical protein
MKKIRFNFITSVATLVSALFIFTACPNDPEPDTLTVSKTRFTFEADNTDAQTATISTSASSWSCSPSASWVKVSTSANTLSISVDKHTDASNSRNATIIIEAGNAEPAEILITQNAKNSLVISPESLSFESNEIGDKTVSITTSAASWDATTDASWVSLSKQGNTLKVTVSTENTDVSPRTAPVKITAGSADERTLAVTQAQRHTLSISPASLSFGAEDTGEKTVTVTTDAPTWNATVDASWIHLTKQDNTLRVSVTASPNTSPRSATVNITAGNAPEKTLTVTQEGGGEIVYNTCLGYYDGEFTGAGTALFLLDLYNSNRPYEGLLIYGFCALPSSCSTFKLTTGTYYAAMTGASRTFFPGQLYEGDILGTNAYNEYDDIYTFCTDGSFTIASSGSSYTISTNLSGQDSRSGASVSNIRVKYSGTISFTCPDDPEPDECPNITGNYTASGTPLISSESAKTWSGRVSYNSSSQRYTITNWGNKDIDIYCNCVDGKILLDTKTRVAQSNDGYDGYLRFGYMSGSTTITYYNEDVEYPISYNANTRILDFSRIMSGYNVGVGVLAFDGSGEFGGRFTDLYANAKLTLTSSYSSPQVSTKAAAKAGVGVLKLPAGFTSKEISDPAVTTKSTSGAVKEALVRKNMQKLIRK